MGKGNLKPVGQRQGLSIDKTPASGWQSVDDLESWKSKLPAAYVYQARAVDPSGNAIALPRLGGADEHGLLYIGHTGPLKDRHRLYKLAKELVDRNNGDCGHGAGKRYWQHGVNVAIQKLCAGYRLEVGWDESLDFDGPASEDVREDAPLPGSGSISTSRKEIARGDEGRLLDEYCQRYAELPPLNHQVGEFIRDEDQLTQRDVSEDFRPA